MVSLRAVAVAALIAGALFALLALPAILRTVFGPIGRLVIPGMIALVVGYVAYQVLSGWHAGG